MLRTPPLRLTTARKVSPNHDSSVSSCGLALMVFLQMAPQTAIRWTLSGTPPKSRPTVEHAALNVSAIVAKLPQRLPQPLFPWLKRDADSGVLAALQNPTPDIPSQWDYGIISLLKP